MDALRLEGLTAGYGMRDVLRDLNLSVEESSMLALIGPNGCGKTTLLRIVSGTLAASQGKVLLFDREVSGLARREISRIVAVVPQESHFAYSFTVEEIVLMGRNPYLKRLQREGPEDYAIVHEAMRFTDVLHLKDRRMDELSGGERQRAVIARAIAQKPRLLLLDEPTAHLDINHQIDVLDLLVKLHRKGMTVLFVSHDLNLASEYSRRIALMDDGQIEAIGTPEEVIQLNLIEKVYEAKVRVEKNPITKLPHVLLPGRLEES
jgi:iron complex transport system ATP-binding protein